MLPTGTAPSPAGDYLDWGVIHISTTNLTIILVMLAVFVLAVLLPFPGTRTRSGKEVHAPGRRAGR